MDHARKSVVVNKACTRSSVQTTAEQVILGNARSLGCATVLIAFARRLWLGKSWGRVEDT
jgi:hypothetical protein